MGQKHEWGMAEARKCVHAKLANFAASTGLFARHGRVYALSRDRARVFFAFKPFLEVVPKKIEVAVLVDRKHKSFPVKVDYVGLSLATTMKDDIQVKLTPFSQASVSLE